MTHPNETDLKKISLRPLMVLAVPLLIASCQAATRSPMGSSPVDSPSLTGSGGNGGLTYLPPLSGGGTGTGSKSGGGSGDGSGSGGDGGGGSGGAPLLAGVSDPSSPQSAPDIAGYVGPAFNALNMYRGFFGQSVAPFLNGAVLNAIRCPMGGAWKRDNDGVTWGVNVRFEPSDGTCRLIAPTIAGTNWVHILMAVMDRNGYGVGQTWRYTPGTGCLLRWDTEMQYDGTNMTIGFSNGTQACDIGTGYSERYTYHRVAP